MRCTEITQSTRALHTVPVEERHIDPAEARHTGHRVEAAGPSLAVEEERRIDSALEVVVRSLGAGVLYVISMWTLGSASAAKQSTQLARGQKTYGLGSRLAVGCSCKTWSCLSSSREERKIRSLTGGCGQDWRAYRALACRCGKSKEKK